ncbi:hypothetical protein L1987_54583 [Smallanthus sonchifolius]|uniref:Uncharacterized protein n=1 Tax=Smallanthus sonchifolius TaxID=185202 RepID=A0ACB9E7K1_9ASTR|nr:hypothetical protein L1987_54583 [Smallanthus sonchifolius]
MESGRRETNKYKICSQPLSLPISGVTITFLSSPPNFLQLDRSFMFILLMMNEREKVGGILIGDSESQFDVYPRFWLESGQNLAGHKAFGAPLTTMFVPLWYVRTISQK